MADNDLMARVAAEFKRSERIQPLADAVRNTRDWRVRLKALDAYYAAVRGDIEEAGHTRWGYDVYEIDWPMLFTPIESALWCDIRALGLVMYPQYPVAAGGRTYYVDFANPARKVALECDGKAFHNAARDAGRDEALKAAGWRVFRFTGTECRSEDVARELERIAREWLNDDEPKPARRVFNDL